mgnify:CR=1 FL=1
MNTATPAITEPSAPSPEVATAFADLDRARTRLRDADDNCGRERRAFRRFAYKHKLSLREARSAMRASDPEGYLVFIRAEIEAANALRAFRRIAMIAAITRVVDTDRRLTAERAA